MWFTAAWLQTGNKNKKFLAIQLKRNDARKTWVFSFF